MSKVSLFGLLPCECWLTIARHSTPPDMYSLSLTTKFFHQPATDFEITCGESEASDGREPKRKRVESEYTVIATLILRASLRFGLGKMLLRGLGKGSFSPEALRKFPTGSVALRGSVLVGPCLGESWDCGDVDLFVTEAAAPAVRSMLVKEGGFMLTGVNHMGYGGITPTTSDKVRGFEVCGVSHSNFSLIANNILPVFT